MGMLERLVESTRPAAADSSRGFAARGREKTPSREREGAGESAGQWV